MHKDRHQEFATDMERLSIELGKIAKFKHDDREWIDPKNSPIMYDVLHFVYVYFLAVKDGNLEPMLDFLINGEYEEHYVKEVEEGYYEEDVPLDQDLYLF